ncbi:hypothetical protein TNCV_2992881 [Trichonephila clavipes]|nr:hypothetical protein TNCV_2992881 [Trichonephila clavipes]
MDERVSRNEREATLEKQKIELAKLQLAQFSLCIHVRKRKRNKYRCGQRTVRLAVVASSKARSLHAQAQQIKTETKTFEKRAEKKTEVREQALPSSHHENPIVE